MFQIWGLGDLVMTVPVLVELRRRYPSADISLVVRGAAQAELLEDSALGLEILKMPPRTELIQSLKFLWKLRGCRFDVAFIGTGISPSLAAGARFLCGIKTVVGDGESMRYLYTHFRQFERGTHRVMRMLETLSSWTGVAVQEPMFDLPVSHAATLVAEKVLGESGLTPRRFVAVHPGSGHTKGGPEKRLPPQLVYDVVDRLKQQDAGLGVLLIFGPDDGELLPLFKKRPPGVGVVCGLRLDVTREVLRMSSGFIGSDSALGHISAAVGVPTVTVAGPTNPAETSPIGRNVTVVTRDSQLSCQPCWNTRLWGNCPFDARCMRDVTGEAVYRAVERGLSRFS